jgi:hypothetical protein
MNSRLPCLARGPAVRDVLTTAKHFFWVAGGDIT